MCRRSSATIWMRTPSCPMWRPSCAASRRSSSHVLANLDSLVVKAVGASGGYGMLVGPHASRARAATRSPRRSRPIPKTTSPSRPSSSPPRRAWWMAASSRATSTCARSSCRGEKVVVTPGALTRVALQPRLPGGQFQPGRRLQGHLGAGRRPEDATRHDARQGRRQPLLARPLRRAGRACRAAGGGDAERHARPAPTPPTRPPASPWPPLANGRPPIRSKS